MGKGLLIQRLFWRLKAYINSIKRLEAAVEFNLVANPFESFLRLFIATVGEDKEFYYRLNLCKAKSHKVIGEFLFVVYQVIFCAFYKADLYKSIFSYL